MLHLLCGKIAAGKSTLSAELGAAPGTVTLAEDAWLARLYPGEIRTVADYVRCAARLRDAMSPHVEGLLRAGISVVLDFPANTRTNRAWMRGLIDRSGARHRLYWLDVPDAVCRARLRQRNADGTHDFAASEADYDAITAHFVPPQADEGFEIEHRRLAE
jgi:predicted kinase